MTRLRKMCRIPKQNNKGLTLIEVMVSVTIFAIMIYPIITQLNSLLKQNYTAKLSQAETDYATRVMEQFKQSNSDASEIILDDEGDIVLTNGKASTKAGYTVNVSNPDAYVYSMDGVKIEKDIDDKETSVVRNGMTYSVEVKLDSSAYETTKGDNAPATGSTEEDSYTYKNPNDTLYYNLENLDDRFCIMVRETSGNYDNRAMDDLVDKIALVLKKERPDRYNQWINGADTLSGVVYNKNTYVKVSYDSSKKKYYATVILSYTDSLYNQTVSYVLMNKKEYDPATTNNKPPAIYLFYNQFAQENQIISGTDTITIDNSGLATGGNISTKNILKCYVVKSESTLGEYTCYKRKSAAEGGGDEVVGGTPTNNVSGSYVYEVKDENGNKNYLWPSFIVELSDSYTEEQINAELDKLDNLFGSEHLAVTETTETGVVTKYIFNNALVPASYANAIPDLSVYDQETGNGYYSYLCKKETKYNNDQDTIEPGEIVYQRSPYEYVWPNGSTTKVPPSTDCFNICTPSKVTYNKNAMTNILLTSDSIAETTSGKPAINLYSNMEKSSWQSSASGVSTTVSTGIENSTDGSATIVSYQTVDVDKFIKRLEDDKKVGANRLYHITLNLYRVEGNNKKRVLTLESGKED